MSLEFIVSGGRLYVLVASRDVGPGALERNRAIRGNDERVGIKRVGEGRIGVTTA